MLGVGLRAEVGSEVDSAVTAWPVGRRRDHMTHSGYKKNLRLRDYAWLRSVDLHVLVLRFKARRSSSHVGKRDRRSAVSALLRTL